MNFKKIDLTVVVHYQWMLNLQKKKRNVSIQTHVAEFYEDIEKKWL